MLLAVLQRTSSIEIGFRVRVSDRTVRGWALGERRPIEPHRLKLEVLYGIPQSAWDSIA